ncbi:hypothetical protein DSECCO2_649410 [anaerobic digester metagenome]
MPEKKIGLAGTLQQICSRQVCVIKRPLNMSYMNRNLPLASEVPYEPRQVVYADGKPACTEYCVLDQMTV